MFDKGKRYFSFIMDVLGFWRIISSISGEMKRFISFFSPVILTLEAYYKFSQRKYLLFYALAFYKELLYLLRQKAFLRSNWFFFLIFLRNLFSVLSFFQLFFYSKIFLLSSFYYLHEADISVDKVLSHFFQFIPPWPMRSVQIR